MTIKDSGTRRSFGTAVRDMGEGKGRFDLMPLDVMAAFMNNAFIGYISIAYDYDNVTGEVNVNQSHLYDALEVFCTEAFGGNKNTMMLEVAKHFEEGCNKYGERNWQSGEGIPVWCYIDSAVRHYVKWLDGQNDERHDRACAWNVMCCIWQYTHNSEADPVDAPDHIEEITIPAENFDEIDFDKIDFTTIDDIPLGE